MTIIQTFTDVPVYPPQQLRAWLLVDPAREFLCRDGENCPLHDFIEEQTGGCYLVVDPWRIEMATDARLLIFELTRPTEVWEQLFIEGVDLLHPHAEHIGGDGVVYSSAIDPMLVTAAECVVVLDQVLRGMGYAAV